MNNFLDIFSPARQIMSARPERFLYNPPFFFNLTRSLAIDVDEDSKQYIIKTDLPGFDVEDVDVSIEDNVLHIVAEHTETFDKADTTDNDKDSELEKNKTSESEEKAESQEVQGKEENTRNLVQERSTHKRLERRIDLGTRKISEEKISASLDKGILTLLVPFEEEDKKKRINIDVRKSILM